MGYRHYSYHRKRRPRPESRTDAERRKFSESVGGIDSEVQQIFLALPEDKLAIVFQRYGEFHGTGALSYAKRTYPRWKSGMVQMSGPIAQRLLNLVPEVLDAEVRYEWVKKLRSMYMQKEHREVSCSPSNWFKMVAPVVDELIRRSSSFQLPADVVEKVNWIMQGDSLAAQALLAQIEVDQANDLAKYLPFEYQRIGSLLNDVNGTTSMIHTIQLPQGTVEVSVVLPRKGLLQAISLANRTDEDLDRRTLFVTCKNSACCAELETTLRGYDGEPIACTSGRITCYRCRATYSYDNQDLHVLKTARFFQIRKGLLGGYSIAYECPVCGTSLVSPIDDSGISDCCPKCHRSFIVPNATL
jgi:hypothetical protein